MTGPEFQHLSVMPAEVLACLQPQPGETFVDGTLGGGGHSRLLLESTAPDGRLIGLDRDQDALKAASGILDPYGDRVILRHANFSEVDQVLEELGIEGIDGMLLDLGVSSFQLDAGHRGFSFQVDAPLDMRMDRSGGQTAAEILQTYSAEELARVFFEYGEERYSRRIARRIVERRVETPLTTTSQLAELVKYSVPKGRVPARIHPATRVFQALRIEVNGELEHVAQGLEKAINCLRPGGRLAVISFHSLEDRLVKRFFRSESQSCICPPRLPQCICNHQPRVKVLTRKGLRATEEEVANNPRSRSAVLRAVRRCPN
ncbi:MAG: 16S rRNA (cytosine(1402)-N(4))-methyltransferase RsmH [Desulfuromonadaceae bacterium]|nr:16S rRNA (cytosine(1402)-N(4))-methyltransferase RsmH [Desulfuromonadaceae bacterium]